MANDFSTKVDIFFNEVVEGFEALNVSANNVSMYKPDANTMALSAQTFYRPMPVLTEVVDGRDVSASYKDLIELTVPTTLAETHIRNVPVQFTGTDMNNSHMLTNKSRAATIMLSNKLDTMVANEIASKGSLVVTNSGDINSYDEAAEADAIMLEQQVTRGERCMLLNPRMAKNLAGGLASRQTPNNVVMDAYSRNAVPPIGGFQTFRTDYGKTITGSSASGYLVNGAAQNTTPVANDADGIPVDNRTQTLAVDTGTAAAVGDCFTIAGVFSVGHINKQSTGQLKTFRITAIDGANWTIAPSIIPADGSADAQKAYANVSTTPADNAAITVINTVTKPSSVFYEKGAVEIVHSDWNMDEFRNSGKGVREAMTDSGVRIAMLSDSNIDTLTSSYRMFIWANVNVLNYEHAGILLEGQT